MTFSFSLRRLMPPPALMRPPHARPALPPEAQLTASRAIDQWVTLGGVPVKLLEFEEAVDGIILRGRNGGPLPLAVASANLDHIKHFGLGSRWGGTQEQQSSVEWLTLLDGAPLVSQARKITHRTWPRLAGSDLIGPLLDRAEAAGLRVGFLGGTPEAHERIKEKFAATHSDLVITGWWAPERSSLTDPAASRALAAEISDARTEILVVCLGKPRQELWISEYGNLTGANVLLAFGAVVDFLAGLVRRAPVRVRSLGLEWVWRLALEPRRLAGRYLLDGPEAYLKLHQASVLGLRGHATLSPSRIPERLREAPNSKPTRKEGFSPLTEHTDVAAVVVTYNSEKDVPVLLDSLRQETRNQSIKVIVADNSPNPSTLSALAAHKDVFVFQTGGNLGYAGGINAAIQQAGSADAFLVLNPDIRVEPGCVGVLREKMAAAGAGVVVPLLLDDDGSVYPSLRREPSVCRALGDAVFGSKLAGRPAWLSEMDFDSESYLHPHKVDWATGAALLIRPDIAEKVGKWDEDYFLYSEETDYLRRVRELGAAVWFEPAARMLHCRGGSGTSPALDALMATNRIKYIRKFHPAGYAAAFHAAVVLSALLRLPISGRKEVLFTVGWPRRWNRLPHAESKAQNAESHQGIPSGAVIIPAHNEAAVIQRTLNALAAPIASGAVEVIVACNGCSDGTEEVAHSYPGVQVIEVPRASKVDALNAGDQAATRWPRLYLDADIELPLEALCVTLQRLAADETVLCARPAFWYDTQGASWPVRSYYRARNRLPQAAESMWGAGVYGLNLKGHDRLGLFPNVTADDCYVDRLYTREEKVTLDCQPVVVRTPRSTAALLGTLNRVYRGNAELGGLSGSHTAQTIRELASSVHGLPSAFDASLYAAFAIAGRLQFRRRHRAWERDDSSRR